MTAGSSATIRTHRGRFRGAPAEDRTATPPHIRPRVFAVSGPGHVQWATEAMRRPGRIGWLVVAALLLSAAAAMAMANAKSGSYKGTTSESSAVTFKITGGGHTILNFSTTLGYNGKCGSGGGPAYYAKASRITIGRGGKFSKKVTLAFPPAHIKAPGKISGTARGTQVHGAVVQYLKGKPNRCYTETFSATKS